MFYASCDGGVPGRWPFFRPPRRALPGCCRTVASNVGAGELFEQCAEAIAIESGERVARTAKDWQAHARAMHTFPPRTASGMSGQGTSCGWKSNIRGAISAMRAVGAGVGLDDPQPVRYERSVHQRQKMGRNQPPLFLLAITV